MLRLFGRVLSPLRVANATLAIKNAVCDSVAVVP
jgi:hypothetical protein